MRKDILYSWLTIALVGMVSALCGALHRLSMPQVLCKEYTFEKVAYLAEGQENNLTFSIRYAYPVAVNASDEVLAKLQRAVCQTVLGDAFLDMRPQQAIEAYAAMKHNEYIQNNLPLLQEWAIDHEDEPLGETLFNEELLISAAPIGNLTGDAVMEVRSPGRTIVSTATGDAGGTSRQVGYVSPAVNTPIKTPTPSLWSYAIDVYEYNGGAHGNRYLLIQNYNLQTGDAVSEQELFIDDYYEPLKALLLEALIAQTDEAETKKDLRRLGYSVADVVPNENFYVTSEGITYVYNPYEIAPYAMGCIQISLPWDSVHHLLRN
ncbi:MAG: RsiV family protein [Paludibacteraceae bacterium]